MDLLFIIALELRDTSSPLLYLDKYFDTLPTPIYHRHQRIYALMELLAVQYDTGLYR